jgi:hypothetical protein
MRKQLFGDDASKTLHPRAPPNANRRRRRLAAQPATSDADARPQLNTSRSSEGSGGNGPGLLHADPARLALCKEREDLNRDAAINKCYSGRVVLSVYAAFLVEWLAHFEGRQLLALPLEGLDQTPRAWLGGVYAFLGLRPPREVGPCLLCGQMFAFYLFFSNAAPYAAPYAARFYLLFSADVPTFLILKPATRVCCRRSGAKLRQVPLRSRTWTEGSTWSCPSCGRPSRRCSAAAASPW